MIKLLTDVQERKKSMAEFKMEQCTDSKKLRVEYQSNTDKVVYGISDMDGRVLSRGDITDTVNEICIKDLKTGRYVIWVMDGDDMIRTNFKVA